MCRDTAARLLIFPLPPLCCLLAICSDLNGSTDYVLEEDARDYVNSIHVEDDPVDKYSLPEQQQYQEPEAETVVEETPPEETFSSIQSAANVVQDHVSAAFEEPVVEPPVKKTWASIVCYYSINTNAYMRSCDMYYFILACVL